MVHQKVRSLSHLLVAPNKWRVLDARQGLWCGTRFKAQAQIINHPAYQGQSMKSVIPGSNTLCISLLAPLPHLKERLCFSLFHSQLYNIVVQPCAKPPDWHKAASGFRQYHTKMLRLHNLQVVYCSLNVGHRAFPFAQRLVIASGVSVTGSAKLLQSLQRRRRRRRRHPWTM